MAYQGWKNYETWAVALWIDNDREVSLTVRAIVREAMQTFEPTITPKAQKRWPRKDVPEALFAAADALKDWLEEEMPELEGPWGTLLQSAFQEIDWDELAENYVEKGQ